MTTLLYIALGFAAGFLSALLVVFITRSSACQEMESVLDKESENERLKNQVKECVTTNESLLNQNSICISTIEYLRENMNAVERNNQQIRDSYSRITNGEDPLMDIVVAFS